jgi:hypothetical protein
MYRSILIYRGVFRIILNILVGCITPNSGAWISAIGFYCIAGGTNESCQFMVITIIRNGDYNNPYNGDCRKNLN